jgi:hypothetical protein
MEGVADSVVALISSVAAFTGLSVIDDYEKRVVGEIISVLGGAASGDHT